MRKHLRFFVFYWKMEGECWCLRLQLCGQRNEKSAQIKQYVALSEHIIVTPEAPADEPYNQHHYCGIIKRILELLLELGIKGRASLIRDVAAECEYTEGVHPVFGCI